MIQPSNLIISSAVTTTKTSDYTADADAVATTTVYVTACSTSYVTATEIDSTTLSSEVGVTVTSTEFATYATTLRAIETSEVDVEATSTKSIDASTLIPTEAFTTLSQTATVTASAAPTPTGFIYQVSAPGSSIDGYYIDLNGALMNYTPSIANADHFALTTKQNYYITFTYTGVPEMVTTGSSRNDYILAGQLNTVSELIEAISPLFPRGVGSSMSISNPLQCSFAGTGEYTGAFTCTVSRATAGTTVISSNTVFLFYTPQPTNLIIAQAGIISSGNSSLTLTGIPQY